MDSKVDLCGSADTGAAVNGGVTDREDRAIRLIGATLDLIRSGNSSLRVLQLGGTAGSLAPWRKGDEIALVEAESSLANTQSADCAVSVDRLSSLSGAERREHLEELRSNAGVILVEAPLEQDAALDDAQRYFEELGDWTTLVTERRFSELPASTSTAERAVLVCVADESAAAIDVTALRTETAPDNETSAVGLELSRAAQRLEAAEQRTRTLEGELGRRGAQVSDLATKLADLSRLAADERRRRRRAEFELEQAKSTRGYRLGLRIFHIRTAIRGAFASVGRTITSPLRLAKRKLRPQRPASE